MWLLSTDRAELHFFGGPEEVSGGYAILSHVWSENEQSFADVREVRSACIASSGADPDDEHIPRPRFSSNPRDHVSDKIRQSCVLAESLGYKWLWNDTCCIDKDNVAELAEAINGMYQYYSLSAVCLAHLADVSPGDPIDEVEFRGSRWHTRGWTLQELIAPAVVKFVARDWTELGSKHTLATLLESVTHIPASVLKDANDLDRCSVAQRISWAKGRQTARVEDRAYSLVGILKLSMVILYGEGHRAFERLQKKIIKGGADTSVFAWGRRLSWQLFCDVVRTERHHHHPLLLDLDLLSRSPEAFEEAKSVVFSTSSWSVKGDGEFNPGLALRVSEDWGLMDSPCEIMRPTYTLTQHGVLCNLPVLVTPSFSVGLLLCFDHDDYLGIVLTPCLDSSDCSRPTYHIGWNGTRGGENPMTVRVLNLGRDLDALLFNGQPVVFVWREVLLVHPLPTKPNASSRRKVGPKAQGPFRIAPTARTALTQHGWEMCLRVELPHAWADSQAVTVHTVFQCVSPEGTRVLLAMGQCFQEDEPQDAPATVQHWANVYSVPPGVSEHQDPPQHSCSEHHIREWPGLAKVFYAHGEGYSLPFTVVFAPLLADAGKTMVLNTVTFELGCTPPGLPWFSPPTVCTSRL